MNFNFTTTKSHMRNNILEEWFSK